MALTKLARKDLDMGNRGAASGMEPRIPRIFESLRNEGIAAGFWTYYEVDKRNAEVNPQEQIVRFIRDVSGFLRPTGRVLSIGCGYGLNEVVLSFLYPDLEITGVDILDDRRSDAKIRSMSQITRHFDASNVSALLADGGRLPFQDGSFDCVLAIDSLSHADYMRADRDLKESQGLLIREMARVVRHGGQVGIVENSAISLRNVMEKGGSACHPVNPFFLGSVLKRLGNEVSIVPYYDLTDRTGPAVRLMGAVVRRSNALGILFAPWFILRARKREPSRRVPRNS